MRARCSLLAVVALAVLSTGCGAATSAATVIPRPAGSDEELPPVTRETLPNGMRLIVQDHRASDIVAIYLWVRTGIRYEEPDQLGYAHFQEHMLFKGTDKFGPGHIDRAWASAPGASVR